MGAWQAELEGGQGPHLETSGRRGNHKEPLGNRPQLEQLQPAQRISM